MTESPDQTVVGVNAGAAQDVPVGPLPPTTADTNEVDMETVLGLSQCG